MAIISESHAQRFPVLPWRYRFGRAATWCVGDFNVQGLANTAWAFATASSSDAQVFAALARAAELRLSDFNVQALANTAWAFAMAAQSDAELFRALAAACGVGDFHA